MCQSYKGKVSMGPTKKRGVLSRCVFRVPNSVIADPRQHDMALFLSIDPHTFRTEMRIEREDSCRCVFFCLIIFFSVRIGSSKRISHLENIGCFPR